MSIRFAQATDQVSRASPPSVAAGFTLLGWVRLRVDRDDFQTLGRVSSGGSTVATWATDIDGTSGPNYFTGGGEVRNSTGLAVDAWRKVAIACTGTTGKAYAQVPGGATELDSGTVSSGVGDLLALGGRGAADTSEWLNGTLAYVRVFASELTQTQIEAEWASPVAVAPAWADWPLTADLLDVSGNGRHLTAGATSGGFEDDPPVGATAAVAGASPRPVGALAGAVRNVGALAGLAPAAVGALDGTARNAGQLAGASARALGVLLGDVRTLAAMNGQAPRAVGALHQAELVGSEEVWRAGAPALARTWSPGAPALARAWSAGRAS